MSSPRLSEEDQSKVDQYLSSGVNETQRGPFKVWILFGVIWVVLGAMMLASYLIARSHGVI